MTERDNRMVKLATLWERTSVKGTRYFSGFMGDTQLLMFRAEEIVRDDGEVVQTWKLLVQERDPERRPPKRIADDPASDKALALAHGLPAGDRIATEPIPDGGDEIPF